MSPTRTLWRFEISRRHQLLVWVIAGLVAAIVVFLVVGRLAGLNEPPAREYVRSHLHR